jgi:hypothetical protein
MILPESPRLLLDSPARQPYIPRHSDSPPAFKSQGAPPVREFRALAFFRCVNLGLKSDHV